MAATARVLTPEQRDRIAVILHGEMSLWVERFGADFVREILDEITGPTPTGPHPTATAAVVVPFPPVATRAVATD